MYFSWSTFSNYVISENWKKCYISYPHAIFQVRIVPITKQRTHQLPVLLIDGLIKWRTRLRLQGKKVLTGQKGSMIQSQVDRDTMDAFSNIKEKSSLLREICIQSSWRNCSNLHLRRHWANSRPQLHDRTWQRDAKGYSVRHYDSFKWSDVVLSRSR